VLGNNFLAPIELKTYHISFVPHRKKKKKIGLTLHPLFQRQMAAERSFIITRPSLDDASRIAEIHVAAMDENPLLHAQCPTPQSILSLQKFLEKEVIGCIRENVSGILVARDPVTDVIVGFARWTSPSDSPNSVKLEESASGARDIEGCRYEYLDGYVALADKAKERALLELFGGRLGNVGEKERCYRKSCETLPCLLCTYK